jgi:hypothetical protein
VFNVVFSAIEARPAGATRVRGAASRGRGTMEGYGVGNYGYEVLVSRPTSMLSFPVVMAYLHEPRLCSVFIVQVQRALSSQVKEGCPCLFLSALTRRPNAKHLDTLF